MTKEHASEDHIYLKWQQPQGAGASNLKELCKLPAKQGREFSVKAAAWLAKPVQRKIQIRIWRAKFSLLLTEKLVATDSSYAELFLQSHNLANTPDTFLFFYLS